MFSVRNISFNSGSIDDFLLTVHFSPLVSAKSMLSDHLRGELLLDVLFDLDTSVLVRNVDQPVFKLNTTYVFESIDAEGEAQRDYCKCQNPNLHQSNEIQPRIGQRFQSSFKKPVIRATARIQTQEDAKPRFAIMPHEDKVVLSVKHD